MTTKKILATTIGVMQIRLTSLVHYLYFTYFIGIASNGSRCLSRTKSNASSFKSFKTFRTSSDDGFCYVPSHRDSGILIDCDMFKYEYFERQHKSHHLTSKRSGEPSHVPTSSFNQDQFDLFDMKDGAKGFEGKHFVRHDTPSTKPRQYPFAISNFLAKDYLGEHEESYDGKYGESSDNSLSSHRQYIQD